MALQRTQYFDVFFKRLLQIARPISSGRTLQSQDMIDPPNIREPPIPQYDWRKDESIALKKARLVYQSRKRGMLENGLLLSTFAAKHLEHLSPTLLDEYDHLINEPSNDWDIFYWATGVKPTPPEYDNTIMHMLKQHVQNADREERIKQPDLY